MYIMIVYMFTFKASLTDLGIFFTPVFKTQPLILILGFFSYGLLALLFQVVVSSHQKEVLFHGRHVVERPLLITSKNKHVPFYIL